MTASLRIQSSKADSNTCESFTRSGLKLESVHQESPRSDIFRKRATKPLLNQRQRQKHLTWAVGKNNWTVAQWSKVLFSDESKFCISFGNQGPRVWQDLAPAHTAKGTKGWFNDHGVTVLYWPANSPDLNPIENLWGIVKRKMRDTRPNNADDLKATVKETWASIPPQQCHKLITSMPRGIEAVIKAKGAPTKY